MESYLLVFIYIKILRISIWILQIRNLFLNKKKKTREKCNCGCKPFQSSRKLSPYGITLTDIRSDQNSIQNDISIYAEERFPHILCHTECSLLLLMKCMYIYSYIIIIAPAVCIFSL